ncbi:hypothetical protein BJ508DRAFT_380403 [Ascobolus immersus RN42]|uniref:Uncharacterized protein n=1 Tax=Ascobolus immersus RN42 TaxID=1160509 RepID=A0A3N4HLS3_ASCIM|nr:hypothetical protein BJ508DRAFT_380403 [Ascobolus immersus RN42]
MSTLRTRRSFQEEHTGREKENMPPPGEGTQRRRPNTRPPQVDFSKKPQPSKPAQVKPAPKTQIIRHDSTQKTQNVKRPQDKPAQKPKIGAHQEGPAQKLPHVGRPQNEPTGQPPRADVARAGSYLKPQPSTSQTARTPESRHLEEERKKFIDHLDSLDFPGRWSYEHDTWDPVGRINELESFIIRVQFTSDIYETEPFVTPRKYESFILSKLPAGLLADWQEWKLSSAVRNRLEHVNQVHLNEELKHNPEDAAKLVGWTLRGYHIVRDIGIWFQMNRVELKAKLGNTPLVVLYHPPAFSRVVLNHVDRARGTHNCFPRKGPYLSTRYNAMCDQDFKHMLSALEGQKEHIRAQMIRQREKSKRRLQKNMGKVVRLDKQLVQMGARTTLGILFAYPGAREWYENEFQHPESAEEETDDDESESDSDDNSDKEGSDDSDPESDSESSSGSDSGDSESEVDGSEDTV